MDEHVRVPTVRKTEQSKARLWRYLPLVGMFVVIGFNIAVYRNPIVYGLMPLLAGALTLAVVIPLNRRNTQLVSSFASREQLSEYISQLPTHMKRFNWVWLEYTMARNIVRGTYSGEPPADFIKDSGYVTRRLVMRTRFNARWVIGGGVVLVIFCAGIAVPLLMLDVFSIWFGLGFVIVPLILSIVWFNIAVGASDDPRRVLARRIEVAADLPGLQRWDELLRIGQDEQSINIDA